MLSFTTFFRWLPIGPLRNSLQCLAPTTCSRRNGTTLDFSSMNGNGITRTCSRCNCCACSSRCDSCACGGCRGCSARVCGRCDSGTCHRRSGCSRRFCSRCHGAGPPAAGATAVPGGGTVVAPVQAVPRPAGQSNRRQVAGAGLAQRCGCSWCERTSCAAAPCQVFSGRRLPEPDRGTARRGTSLSFQGFARLSFLLLEL